MTALQQTIPCEEAGRFFRVQVRVPEKLYEVLRRVAFEQRTSQQAIALEGLRLKLEATEKEAS